MAGAQGPQGTGDKFKNFVAKFLGKGKTDLQARKIAATSNTTYKKRKKRNK